MGDKVRCPVCGMPVQTEKAAGTTDYEGVTYYFCAPNCLERFNEEPAKYVGQAKRTDTANP